MHPLLLDLKKEHQEIFKMIEEGQILPLLDFVERVHHVKEETLLFPRLANHPLLRQGGPRCTYFMGLELDLGIYEPAKNILEEFYRKSGQPPPTAVYYEWLKGNTPLRIPMDEHKLGHALASAIRHLMKQKVTPPELTAKIYEQYCRLLKLHVEKEDTCLFLIADTIMRIG